MSKPYDFVPLPGEFSVSDPVWHDGSRSAGRLSGEIRFELKTLTPLLVGCERQALNETTAIWPIAFTRAVGTDPAVQAFLQTAAIETHEDAPANKPWQQEEVDQKRARFTQDHAGRVVTPNIPGLPSSPSLGFVLDEKPVLSPLRTPDGLVILQADSLKGLLRHEIGALLGAPMERVAERSYSYRPNATSSFVRPTASSARLVAAIARVPQSSVEVRLLDPTDPASRAVRVPTQLEVLPLDLRYDKEGRLPAPRYQFDAGGAPSAAYRGGLGAGQKLKSTKRSLHSSLHATPGVGVLTPVLEAVIDQYLRTLRHLLDDKAGHFSGRHPNGSDDAARERILAAAQHEVFTPGDLIWVEWDKDNSQIVSFGWHYYYRWAYTDSVRLKGWLDQRAELTPHPAEINGTEPTGLTAVRRLFGYVSGEHDAGTRGIGEGDHSQLMGRLFVNSALEIVPVDTSEEDRFIPFTFLRELGQPRPSAVEHYVTAPSAPADPRPFDQATQVTYGDATGHDTAGALAGRKFYLDRKDAYVPSDAACGQATGHKPWCDDGPGNRMNLRSTLALMASTPERTFRFTLRFRDLDRAELIAVLVAMCPHQFAAKLGGSHPDGYCSKLGSARPLGWGSVQILAKHLLLLNDSEGNVALDDQGPVARWFDANRDAAVLPHVARWLSVHRCKHPDAGDYPTENGKIFTHHTALRSKHAHDRRLRRT